MDYPIFTRNFQVDYFKKDEGLWHITSHLKDHIHDILVTVDVSVPLMVIQEAEVKFIRYPREGCIRMVDRMHKIVGANLFTDFREKLIKNFAGSEGCYNIMNLLSVAAPGLIWYYFPYLVTQGKMKPQDWQEIIQTKLAENCIAY
jgi:hypothetical protein